MPRTPRPRSTTLYLPNPGVPAAGSSGSTPAPAPTLEVLLVAQQIAHARGHTFDIDSFLSPEQRDEYLSLLAARDDDLHDDEEQREGTSEPQGEGSNRGDSDTNGNGNSDGPQTDTDSVTPEGEKRERTPSAGPGDDRGPLKRARLAAHASPLAQAYWRQRLDRMSSTPRIKAEDEGTPAPVVAPSPTPSYTSHWARRHEPPPPLTAADRAEIQESAQFWNHLLIEAREARGRQKDYNTGQYQYDRGSAEYYSQGQVREPTPPPTPPAAAEPLPNGTAAAAAAGATTSGARAAAAGTGAGAAAGPSGSSSTGPASTPGASGTTPRPGPPNGATPTPDPPTPGRPPSSSSRIAPSPIAARPGHPSPVASAAPGTPGVPPGMPLPPGGVAQSPRPAPQRIGSAQPPTPGTQAQVPSPAGQRPLHPGFAQHAQAQVQAQALALGAGEGFMNPGVMLGGMRPSGTPDTPALVPAGINPLALMGGGGAGNGPPGPFGGGPGPMLTGGGWGEGAFSS